MNENKNNESFTYTYSAKHQEEVKAIRQKYIPKEQNKMEQLRKLDQSATRPGMITALIVGIIGTLVMGVGMSLCMVWTNYFVWGIIVGIIGMIGIAVAYPLYSRITKKQRAMLAPQIQALSDELLKQN